MTSSGTQRSEAWVLLPVALLTLVALSTYTLLHERRTVALLAAERQMEADRLARWMSRQLAGRGTPTDDQLRRLQGAAAAVAVIDEQGLPAVTSGDASVRAQIVTGTAPLELSRRSYTVRVDLPSAGLASRQKSLAVLTPVVLVVNIAITLLVLVYLRHLLTPLDRLMARARQAGRVPSGNDDEVAFLVSTLEEALDALGRTAEEGEQGIATDGEAELEALERTLTRSLESGVLLCDREGRVLALNTLGAELLRLAPPEPGTPLVELLAPYPELFAILQSAIQEQRGVGRQDYTLLADDTLHTDGTLLADDETSSGLGRTLGLTMHPLRRDDGAVRGYLALFIDLTAIHRRAEERRISESLARLGELAAGVAHEMRNSLATLRGYLTLIERGGGAEAITEYVAEIRHETDQLKRIVDDFLTFARPGSTHMEVVAVEPLLRRIAADPSLAGVVELVVAEKVGTVESLSCAGDSQLLERAIFNLVSNAVEAHREAGVTAPVSLIVSSGEDELEILVEDQGRGISDEVRERLFHPFATHRPDGVGLGLALARRIVELHGGRLRLDDRPSGGARAEIRLPRGAIDTFGNKEG